jgi:hypothetical protein
VIKSSGKEPPRLFFNFLNIYAKFIGDICFAASIRNPEKPIANKSVK